MLHFNTRGTLGAIVNVCGMGYGHPFNCIQHAKLFSGVESGFVCWAKLGRLCL